MGLDEVFILYPKTYIKYPYLDPVFKCFKEKSNFVVSLFLSSKMKEDWLCAYDMAEGLTHEKEHLKTVIVDLKTRACFFLDYYCSQKEYHL